MVYAIAVAKSKYPNSWSQLGCCMDLSTHRVYAVTVIPHFNAAPLAPNTVRVE